MKDVDVKVGELIAQGELTLSVVKPKINSGWSDISRSAPEPTSTISNAAHDDREKIATSTARSPRKPLQGDHGASS